MAFEGLSEKLQRVFSGLKGRGTLSESDINSAMREIKLALLEADVNYKVVKDFVAQVKEKALGEEVLRSVTPGQQVIKIVNDELTALMGGAASKLTFSSTGFTIFMMVGLQGTGKTTTCGKLALYLKGQGKKPMLCACDVYRPAAIDQLEVVGNSVSVPVYTDRNRRSPEEIASAAAKEARIKGYDVLIVDTAGRLQIDEDLMAELERLKAAIRPQEILLAVDALTGQDAVKAAEGFNDRLGIDGIIMTKLDGDARGGAALSVKSVTGRPIKFIGVGEKMDALEPFHPERMANRILGMGDVVSLVEKAQETMDMEKASKLEARLRKNKFTLEDFLDQIGQINNMGGLGPLLDMVPGISAKQKQEVDMEQAEREFRQMEAIILSMTKEERDNPSILNSSRRKRIAAGSGQTVNKVNNLIRKYDEMRKMMKQFTGGRFKRKGALRNM